MSGSTDGRTFVIFNPASGRGRGAGRMAGYLALLEEHLPGFEHAVTSRAGHERELAETALAEGFDTLVAVGGDGTWSHVADRIMASERRDVRLGVLPAGTGNDFGRNLGLRYAEPGEAVRSLAAGHTTQVDVGRVVTACRKVDRGAAHEVLEEAGAREAAGGAGTGTTGTVSERRAARHFLNVVGFGFDVAVIEAAARARFLRGELLYKVTALQQLFRFPGLEVAVVDEEGFRREGTHLMVTVSNGAFFGGGFPIAPEATLTDGVLHACLIGDASPARRALLFNAAEKGRHVESERVETRNAPSFTLTFPVPPRFEIDGDLFQAEAETVEVEVLKGALEVVGT